MQVGTVSLGPGLLTYPEIAEKLSTPQRPLVCSEALQQRAAFVYLKPRPREEIETLLAHSLGVSFRRSSGSTVMEPDAGIAQREENWRRRFAANLRSTIQRRFQRFQTVEAMAPDEIKRVHAALQAEEDKAREAAHDNEDDPAVLRVIWRLTPYSTVLVSDQLPEMHIGMNWLRQNIGALSVENAMRHGVQLQSAPASAAPELEKFTKMLAERKIYTPPADLYAVGGLQLKRDPDTISLNPTIFLASLGLRFSPPCPVNIGIFLPEESRPALVTHADTNGKPTYERRLVDDIFAGTTQSEDILPGLGPEAAAWLASERSATQAFLAAEAQREKSPGGTSKLAAGSPPVWRDVPSAAIAEWSKAQDRETILELMPTAECGKPIKGDGPASLFSVRDFWTLREESGVLMVQDQLAFLDHARRLPVGSLARLIRKVVERTSTLPASPPSEAAPANPRRKALPRLLTPIREELTEYVTEADRLHEDAWLTPPRGQYWGLDLSQLDDADPALFLWRRLAPRERDAAVAGDSRYPLERFDTAALQTVAELLRRNPEKNGKLWDPAALAELRKCTLNVRTLQIERDGSQLSFP